MVATAKMEAVYSDSNTDKAPPVLRTLSHTIAHLLSFLADSSLHTCVFSDLVMLLEDCCFLLEENYFPVKLNLLDDCCEHASVALDCSVEISQPEQVWTLQTAAYMALNMFMNDLKRKGSRAQFGLHPKDTFHPVLLPSGLADLNCRIADHGTRNECIETIVASIRPVLLLECPQDLNESLFHQARLAASHVLKQIISDWSCLAPTTTSFTECAILVVRAIGVSTASDWDEPPEYLELLGEFLRLIVLDPPVLAGYPFHVKYFQGVGKEVLRPLLDCIINISQKNASSRTFLDGTVLAAVHLLWQQEHWRTRAASYCLSNGMIPGLLGLLEDGCLATYAAAILSELLPEVLNAKELNAICQAVIEAHDQQAESNHRSRQPVSSGDKQGDRSFIASEPPARKGSKRKRQSTKTSASMQSHVHALESSNIPVVRNTLHQAWVFTLRELLHRALGDAGRIDEAFASLGNNQSAPGAEKLIGDIDEGIPHVASTIRLISVMISKYSEEGIEGISALYFLAQRLVEAIEAVCNARSDHSLETLESPSQHVIIDCALGLHYSTGKMLTTPNIPYLQKCLKFIIAASNVAQKLILQDDSFKTPGIHSLDASNRISSFLPMLALRTMQGHGELSSSLAWKNSILRGVGSSNRRDLLEDFLNIASLDMINAMSLGARYGTRPQLT